MSLLLCDILCLILIHRDVFSLVAFAQWPLTVNQVQEAVSALRSDGSSRKDSAKQTVFMDALLESFYPLIELQSNINPSAEDDVEDASNTESIHKNKICRLFHSTLFDFLQQNTDVYSDSDDRVKQKTEDYEDFKKGDVAELHVSSLRVAEACILYMLQDKYRQPLRKRNDSWINGDSQPVAFSEGTFLLYAVRTWIMHLEAAEAEVSKYPPNHWHIVQTSFPRVKAHLHTKIQDFINSTNFLTYLQILTLRVTPPFCVFFLQGSENDISDKDCTHIGRTLPSINTYLRDYLRLWNDWGYFLQHEEYYYFSHDTFEWCRGELQRCWWESLRSENFLSKLPSSIHSFKFLSESIENKREMDYTTGPCMQAMLATSNGIKVLWSMYVSKQ